MRRKRNVFILLIFLSTFVVLNAQSKYIVVDSGLVFQDAPFKSCHASTVVELENGTVLCAWFGGDYEGHRNVSIWTSEFDKSEWSSPTPAADGIMNDSVRYACWNPVLYNDKHTTHLFYKVGKSPSTWWGEYKRSENGGKTWSKSVKLPNEILGPIKNKPIKAGKAILHPSSTETTGNTTWKSFIEISDKNFKNWKKIPIDTVSMFKVIQPTLLRYSRKRLQLLMRSDSNEILQSWSSDNGRSWGRITSAGIKNPNSGIDAVDLKDGSKLLVYNPTQKGKDWWEGRNKLSVMETTDGKVWRDILILEDHPKGEFSYPAIIQLRNEDIFITYTYDRKNIKYVIVRKETN